MGKRKEETSGKALKSGIWYTGSTFLLKAIGFITTPIFARLLSTSDYGYFSNFLSWQQIFLICVSMDLHTTLTRARFDYKEDLQGYTASIATCGAAFTFIAYLVIITYMDFFVEWLCLEPMYIHLMFLYLLVVPAKNILLTIYRFNYKYKLFSAINITTSVCIAFLSILLVTTMTNKLLGRVVGYTVPYLIVGIACYYVIFSRKGVIQTEYCKYALRVAFPFIPYLLSQVLLGSSDKIMITKMCGAAFTALYSIPYTCSSIISMLQTSIRQAWTPWFTDALHSGNKKKCSKGAMSYAVLLIILSLPVYFLGPEILYILGGESYMEAKYLLPLIVCGCIFLGISNIFIDIEIYEKKTITMAIATIFSALSNIALNFLLIPRYGYAAAAATTLIGYIILFFIHYYTFRKLNYNWLIHPRKLFALLTANIILMFICFALYSNNIIRYCLIVLLLLITSILTILYNKRIKSVVNQLKINTDND